MQHLNTVFRPFVKKKECKYVRKKKLKRNKQTKQQQINYKMGFYVCVQGTPLRVYSIFVLKKETSCSSLT